MSHTYRPFKSGVPQPDPLRDLLTWDHGWIDHPRYLSHGSRRLEVGPWCIYWISPTICLTQTHAHTRIYIYIHTLEVQPPFFKDWFPNHHYFSRGLSSSVYLDPPFWVSNFSPKTVWFWWFFGPKISDPAGGFRYIHIQKSYKCCMYKYD